MDGVRTPAPPLRTRDPIRIKSKRDAARRPPRSIFAEDAPDDLGFGLVDVPLAGDRLPIGADRSYDIVAEAQPATSFALFDTATLATPRFVREVRQENRKTAFIVPLRPTCSDVTSPSDSVTSRTPTNRMRLKSPAISF